MKRIYSVTSYCEPDAYRFATGFHSASPPPTSLTTPPLIPLPSPGDVDALSGFSCEVGLFGADAEMEGAEGIDVNNL